MSIQHALYQPYSKYLPAHEGSGGGGGGYGGGGAAAGAGQWQPSSTYYETTQTVYQQTVTTTAPAEVTEAAETDDGQVAGAAGAAGAAATSDGSYCSTIYGTGDGLPTTAPGDCGTILILPANQGNPNAVESIQLVAWISGGIALHTVLWLFFLVG